MSLLMDALKKAEEEKKRAAKQLKEVEESPRDENTFSEEETGEKGEAPASGTPVEREKKPASDHLELTLAPLESKELYESDGRALTEEEEKALSSTHEELEVSRELIDEAKQKQQDLEKSFSEGLTLDNIEKDQLVRDESLEDTVEAPKEEMDLDDSVIIEGLMTSDEPSSPSFDDTFHGVVFDDDEGSNYEETLPGVTAEQLSRDLGGGVYQPTPVAAKTVFNAGRAGKKKNSFKWGIFSVLVLLAVGSFAIFYYFSITPVARKMPPPDVARGIESTPAAIPRIPVANNESVSGTLISRDTEEPAVAVETQQTDTTETVAVDIEKAPVETGEELSAEIAATETNATVAMAEVKPTSEAEAVASVAVAPVEAAVAQVAMQEPVERARAARPPSEFSELDQQSMRISKESRIDAEAILVRQGFDAYQKGDLGLAKSLYQDALNINADNRDALLGLAAIAIKFNDLQEAFIHYSRLLNVNPDDAMAMTALQSLNKNLDPVKGETAIKLMLQKEADNPFLHFNLGNIFAKQQRWPEAQQAFFDAFRLDDGNAAYAMNLAVSLDHMQQYAAAISYYQSALDLALAGSASLNTAAIQQRINSLTSIVQK